MKKSLKTFRDFTTTLSYTEMQMLKGGIDERECYQQQDLECHEFTHPNGGFTLPSDDGNTAPPPADPLPDSVSGVTRNDVI